MGYCPTHVFKQYKWQSRAIAALCAILIWVGKEFGSFHFQKKMNGSTEEDIKAIVEYCGEKSIISGVLFQNQLNPGAEIILEIPGSGKDVPLTFTRIIDKPYQPLCFFGDFEDGHSDCNFRIRHKDDGLLISLNLYDYNFNPVGVIVDNEFRVNDQCQFMVNYDNRAIEIVDNELRVVFSLELVSTNKFVFLGNLSLMNNAILLSGGPADEIIMRDHSLNKDFEKFKRNIPRKFKYTGDNWRHQRI